MPTILLLLFKWKTTLNILNLLQRTKILHFNFDYFDYFDYT